MRSFYWRIREETKLVLLWFVCAFPVGPGAWLRARLLPLFLEGLGKNTLIQQGLRVTSPKTVRIGSNCNFGQGVFIAGGGGVRIGDWVGLGPDVKIWSVNHRFEDCDTPWLLQGFDYHEVVIEDDVWLAANVFVMPGTTIGRGAIVAAGSVVNKSIPAYALYAGNPGRVVGWRKPPEQVSPAPSTAVAAPNPLDAKLK
jgi:acetyltransferase-like isoleucine patch superfamily enzyme